MARKVKHTVSEFHDFIKNSDLVNIPFMITDARNANIDKKQGDGPEPHVVLTVSFKKDGEELVRDLTLSANAYRQQFVEAFKTDKEPIGPVNLVKKFDESKGKGKGSEVWQIVDTEDAIS